MVSLLVNYGPAFSEVVKKTKEVLNFDEEIRLKELLNYYFEKYGDRFKSLIWKNEEKGQYHDQLSIIINGKSYRDENFLNTVLKDGDDIYFLFLYFGG